MTFSSSENIFAIIIVCLFTFVITSLSDYYAPPLIRGGIKRCFCLTSGAYIGPEVAHVTRDSDTTFRVKRSRSRGQLILRRKMCHIFIADKATLFKFRILTDCGQFLFTDCKCPLSERGVGDVTLFRNFAMLSTFRKRLKLCFSTCDVTYLYTGSPRHT